MKITGVVESLEQDERGIKLKVAGYERAIWVPELSKTKLRGIKVGDQVTVQANPGRWHEFLVDIEKGEADSGQLGDQGGPQTHHEPPLPEQPPKTSDYNIPYSYSKIGPLYPMLVDQEGHILDGLHRHEVDPDWPKVIVHVDGRKDFLVKRIHANLHRRTVPKEERQRDFTELANILHGEGVAIGKLAEGISELTGFSQMYVEQLLPRSLKLKTKPKGTAGRFSSTKSQIEANGVKAQPETLPDQRVDLEEEARKRATAVDESRPQPLEDLYVMPCPACGIRLRWDPGRKILARAAN